MESSIKWLFQGRSLRVHWVINQVIFRMQVTTCTLSHPSSDLSNAGHYMYIESSIKRSFPCRSLHVHWVIHQVIFPMQVTTCTLSHPALGAPTTEPSCTASPTTPRPAAAWASGTACTARTWECSMCTSSLWEPAWPIPPGRCPGISTPVGTSLPSTCRASSGSRCVFGDGDGRVWVLPLSVWTVWSSCCRCVNVAV